jgi:hypothetical protein
MKELIRQKGMFEHLSKDLDNLEDGFLDEPSFFVWVDDGEDGYRDTVDTEQYFSEYCNSSNSNEVHLFTENYHFHYLPDFKELSIYQMFHFNTSEYGVPPEYYRDELHDAVDSQILLKYNGFWFSDAEYTYNSEEERFQLSCTDLGFYIDVVERAREMFFAEMNREH